MSQEHRTVAEDAAQPEQVDQRKIVKVENAELEMLARRRNELLLAKHRLSFQAHRLFLYILSQVKDDHDENTEYEFSVYELAQKIGIDRVHLYGSMVTTLDELARTIVHVPVFGKNGQVMKDMFDRVGLIKNRQRVRTVKEGEDVLAGSVTVSLHKELLPYVSHFKERYTEVDLKYVFRLTSSYSQRLYDLLKVRAFTGKPWKVERGELRQLLGLEEGKFELWGDFRRFVLERAQTEICNHTDLAFDLDYINSGRTVTDVIFRLRKEGGHNVASLPGTVRHTTLKGMLDLGLPAKEAEAMLNDWWDTDPERIRWHLTEAKRQVASGKVRNALGWFKAGMKKDYRPDRPLFKELQQRATDKRADYERNKEAFVPSDELQKALSDLTSKFDVDGVK